MTFTKLFSSITESTVWAESSDVRIVWVTMLAMCNWDGIVEGSVPGLAHRARVPLQAVQEALDKFMAPDPWSRTEDNEGRRIEKVDGGWRLLNYVKHREHNEKSDPDHRREYMRELMRRKRSVSNSVSSVSNPLANVSSVSTDVDRDRDTDKEESKSKAKALRAFTPPSLEEVALYCKERNNGIDPEKFVCYYESVGWRKRGGNQIKNWRAAVITWEKNNFGGEFRDGYQKTGRIERQQLGTQAQRALNNIRAAEAAFMGSDSGADSPGQEARPSGGNASTLEGEIKKLSGGHRL